MQTTNRHAADYCGCVPAGEVSPHGSAADCAANRSATGILQAAMTRQGISEAIGRGDLLRAAHDQHLTPHYGCPACPLDSRFRRDSKDSPWYVS